MNTYNINQIATVLQGELIKGSGGKISYLLIDSRKVIFARESLFFALKGERNDGHLFISDLYAKGIRNFVVQQYPDNIENYARANFLKVNDSLTALRELVCWHRSQIKVPVVGITGSNGKTIIKEWIYQCLLKGRFVVRNPKSFNSQVGVPLSVWLLQSNADLGVFEAGISKPNEMNFLEQIIQPNIGIFTNIGDAHQDNFNTIDEKIKEKLKLFKNCESLIYCKDHFVINKLILEYKPSGQQLFSWGKSADSNLVLLKVHSQDYKTQIIATYLGKELNVTIPFVDKASIENAMHVWSLLLVLKEPHEQIQAQLLKLETVGMRLELKEGLNNCSLINDTYNSDLESLHIALDFLSNQNQHKVKMLILSDIEQSGFNSRELYLQVAGMVKHKKIDRLIGIGETILQYSDLFEVRKYFYKTTDEFLQHFSIARLNDMSILIKGARSFMFERISKQLQKQTHRTVLEIDLNAIEYNLNYFRHKLKSSTGIIAMVKAFSYGSGTYELANLLQYQNVSALAVAFADEGFGLRANGIKLPILVMNPDESSFAAMIEQKLEPVIYNFLSLNSFNEAVKQSKLKTYPVHIKIDTGMHRSGFLAHEIDKLIVDLKESTYLKIRTTFSHLTSSDEPDHDDFTRSQIQLFDELSTKIQIGFSYKIKRHILNSAGIERFNSSQFDMVRLGIGMYGVSVNDWALMQVSSLKSCIAQVKTVKGGSSVGYNRKGRVSSDAQIATVPIGYADGLRRSLSNGVGEVWVNGKRAPIIGNICMDMCMINITGIDAKEGDAVEVFGKNLPIKEVAERMQTIPYEVLTGISQRVKRTYHVE